MKLTFNSLWELRGVGRADGQKERVRKGWGRAVAEGFVLVLLAENMVGHPNHPFSLKRGEVLQKKGKSAEKDAGKKRGYKQLLGKKRGLLLTREQSGEGAAGGGFQMLEVSGGYEGLKERFSKLKGLTVVLNCMIRCSLVTFTGQLLVWGDWAR